MSVTVMDPRIVRDEYHCMQSTSNCTLAIERRIR